MGMDDERMEQLALPQVTVLPANRNGHAQIIGKIIDIISATPGSARMARTVRLSPEDEVSLKDADERQLVFAQISIAKEGTKEASREMFKKHFLLRFDLQVSFDAPETTAE
jgi:hypothetical protein